MRDQWADVAVIVTTAVAWAAVIVLLWLEIAGGGPL